MIEARCVTKSYPLGLAVKQVSLTMQKNEIVGLVGESGSGKSTLGRLLCGLIAPSSGQILFHGSPLTALRPTQIQMIFQDPTSSLNPRMKIKTILKEPTDIHHLPDRTDELLQLVGLPNFHDRYPHELSGGQRQRVSIARALSLNPELLICDEPISSLDVSIQAQIINLLLRLHKELGLTLLFIAHDLAVVRYMCTRVAVMYQGEIVETQETEALFTNPSHPYTRLLLASRPRMEGMKRGLQLSPTYMGVPIGRPDVGMSEHVLNEPQVGPIF